MVQVIVQETLGLVAFLGVPPRIEEGDTVTALSEFLEQLSISLFPRNAFRMN